LHSKENLKETKRQHMEGEKIFAKKVTDKRLFSKISKSSCSSTSKKKKKKPKSNPKVGRRSK